MLFFIQGLSAVIPSAFLGLSPEDNFHLLSVASVFRSHKPICSMMNTLKINEEEKIPNLILTVIWSSSIQYKSKKIQFGRHLRF
jgi:hypothetical protein